MVAVVTGAWGFLGRAIATELDQGGWLVVRAGRPETEIPSREFDDLVRTARPELVVHCAGPASVPDSLADPYRDFRGSVLVLASVGETMRRFAPQARLLHLSSAAVYGEPDRLPIREDDPVRAVSPYGYHRIACEVILRELVEVEGLRTATLRVFSAYGEGLRRQIMWDVCTKAIRDRLVMLLGTGDESRDFVHAVDVGRAVVTVASNAPFEGEAYNVASGIETTTRDLAGLLVESLGVDVPVTFTGERRRGDPVNWRADLSRIASLGFAPSVPIAEGARVYTRWARAELVT